MSLIQSLIKDKLFKGGSTILFASLVGSIANYFFQFFMSRKLSVEDFGIMNTLFSLFVITGIPGAVILVVMAKYTSKHKALEQESELHHFYLIALKLVALGAAILFSIYVIFSTHISDYLKIDSNILVIILAGMLFITFLKTVNLGIIQGLQMFGLLGAVGALGGILRLLFGIGFIYMGLKLIGAICAPLVAGFIVLIITYYPLRSFFKRDHIKTVLLNRKEILSYSVPVLLSAMCLMVFSNIDIILIKHYFTPDEAGQYAAGAILGRIIFQFPGAIVIAFFPIVAEAHTLNKNVMPLLSKGLIFTAILSGVGTILYMVIPEFIVSSLFGSKFIQTAPLLKLFGFAMLPMALLNILINFNLARHRTNFVYTLVIGSIAEIVLICLIHDSLAQVIYIMIGVSVILFIVNYSLVFIGNRNEGKEEISGSGEEGVVLDGLNL
jgi:O-antigen/teichoic acid export membrane protein